MSLQNLPPSVLKKMIGSSTSVDYYKAFAGNDTLTIPAKPGRARLSVELESTGTGYVLVTFDGTTPDTTNFALRLDSPSDPGRSGILYEVRPPPGTVLIFAPAGQTPVVAVEEG